MTCCGEASGWTKVGFICVFLAFGLQIAGLLTNYWKIYNTVNDVFDIRVGLFWFTNCASSGCQTSSTPSTYHSLFFTLTKYFEVAATGLFLIIVITYGFYVLADRSRTRCTAVVIIVLLVIADMLTIAGVVLWILEIDHPYFLGWSAGLSIIATGLGFFSLLCLIPDLKEYPYYSKLAIYPMDDDIIVLPQKKISKHDTSNKPPKKEKIVNDPKRKTHLKNPYSVKDSYMDDDIDRYALNMVTPSKPPRYDFITQNRLSTKL